MIIPAPGPLSYTGDRMSEHVPPSPLRPSGESQTPPGVVISSVPFSRVSDRDGTWSFTVFTPKYLTRLPMAARDIDIDTTLEVPGQAVRSFDQNYYSFVLFRAFSSSLNMQDMRRIIGGSTLGNEEAMLPDESTLLGKQEHGLP
jgi:hypothetical protein